MTALRSASRPLLLEPLENRAVPGDALSVLAAGLFAPAAPFADFGGDAFGPASLVRSVAPAVAASGSGGLAISEAFPATTTAYDNDIVAGQSLVAAIDSTGSGGRGRSLLETVAALGRPPLGPILTPRATYRMEDTLNADQPDAPPLYILEAFGRSRFESATVLGQPRRVIRLDGDALPARANAGLVLDTTGLVAANYYTLELVFELVEGSGTWRKFADTQGRQSDAGLYVTPSNNLNVYPEGGGVRPFPVNQFRHVVLTNQAGPVQVYLDGSWEFWVPNTSVMNINNPGNLLHLFLDDDVTAGEYADARVALVRIYADILSPNEVALLAADPFAYP